MAIEKLNSNDIGVYISTDVAAGTGLKEIVCGTDITYDTSREITKRRTKCGPISGVGELEATVSFGGVANVTPTVLSEMSLQELEVINQQGDPVWVEIKHRTTPSKYYRQFVGGITTKTENLPEGDVVDFDVTIEADGDVAIVAPA